MTQSQSIPDNQRLIIALDVPEADDARALVNRIGDAGSFYKIGLELFMTGDAFELLRWLRDQDKQVFVDLKLFDIPATVARAVKRLDGSGARFVTVHGNDAMMKAAADAADAISVLAVTVLTSLDRGDLDDLGFECDVEKLVLSRARRAAECGCDGVVASGREAAALRQAIGDRLLIVSPGIRPVENRSDEASGGEDQKRMVTVPKAFEYGADYIVVGRPIRDAEDPRQAALEIGEQIRQVVCSTKAD
ncbi:MAG: orotidine 5'-phosphate decarboxylase [marine bacterium B5-7]|nr:MAG: orotidine 5'-phosphate decarboxylase [marine bacterium B5-7]